MATNALRMSGLNSGLDTEAIVNALTAATKNKINKNQRSILQLQAQQEAYRDIISKFNAFKDKYFDILNVGTCLKSKTMFNSFKSTLTSSSGTNYVPGVTVSSSGTANTGTYNVKVNKVATQSTRKSSNVTGKALDLENGDYESGKDYTMKVTVGSKSEYITFKAGDTAKQTQDNINEELKKTFGVSNSGKGLVSLDEDGKFTSTDKSAVTYTNPTLYDSERNVDLSGGLKTGNNSFTITVNGQTKTVSFSTVSEDYFDDIFDEEGNLKKAEDLDSEGQAKLKLYKDVVLNQRDGEVYKSYESWWEGLDDDQKAAFAEEVASKKYDSAKQDIQSDYEAHREAAMQMEAYQDYLDSLPEGGMSFGDFVDHLNETGGFTQEDIEAFEASEAGQELIESRDKALEKLDKLYDGYTEAVVNKEIQENYNKYFEVAKENAWNAQYGAMDPEDDGYVSYDDFKYTKAEFEETSWYTSEHLTEAGFIKDSYEGRHIVDLDSMSDSQRAALYDEFVTDKKDEDGNTILDKEDYIAKFAEDNGGVASGKEAAYLLNKANIENNLNGLRFNVLGGVTIKAEYGRDGQLNITAEGALGDAFTPQFAITASAGNANDFGFDTTDITGTASQVSTSSKLSELDIEPDAKGNYNFSINGVKFSFTGDTTISDMMKQINASTAGVKMSYTTLTNQFIITANEYGRGVDIDLGDDQGVLEALGFVGGGEFTEGTNTQLEINGVEVETTSNSYTVDGTTFTFTQAAEGQEFTNEVARDYSKAMDVIKSFVEDYNKLIDDIYGYVDDEPNKDYYFLTDDDIDEMQLSESQQNKWEKMAKKGLLYRDNTLTDIMSRLRTVLYNSVDAADGSKVGLFTLGITTSSDYANHGKLVFDETKDFEALFTQYADEITELFTNSENGIATQFEKIIDNATRTTGAAGERGSLVDKAGVSGTASATSNTIYNKIKSLQDMIATLQARYEQQQDRYWKIYGNMETMLGNLNSQTSYINQLLGSY